MKPSRPPAVRSVPERIRESATLYSLCHGFGLLVPISGLSFSYVQGENQAYGSSLSRFPPRSFFT
jgi:hypothetical protein